jgi:DNA-binding FrmR family transcriptional regulator
MISRGGNMAEDVRGKVLLRLRKIEGQVKSVERMIEAGEPDCAKVLNLVLAIKAAVNQVGIMVVKNYSQECIIQADDAKSFEKALNDTLQLMTRVFK